MISPARICNEPGCGVIVPSRGKCSECQRAAERTADAKRPSAAQRGYDARWRRFARRFLRDHPTCEDPEGCMALASDVDHIDGKGPLGPRGFDPTNCRAMCHSHHSRRTGRDQPGGWAA